MRRQHAEFVRQVFLEAPENILEKCDPKLAEFKPSHLVSMTDLKCIAIACEESTKRPRLSPVPEASLETVGCPIILPVTGRSRLSVKEVVNAPYPVILCLMADTKRSSATTEPWADLEVYLLERKSPDWNAGRSEQLGPGSCHVAFDRPISARFK